MKPIFLISLPRSGSTLLQSLLMRHPEIRSTSEPWIMLPLVYMTREGGTVTEYDHSLSQCAINDFINFLPGGKNTFKEHLNKFVTNLYASSCTNQESYFLDKTPRYYLIINELAELFPEAKFIFLTRNPAQVVSSIISSFSNNNLRNLHWYQVDLQKGIERIAQGMGNLSERKIHVTYEKLIHNPETELNKILSFLELEWSSDIKDDNTLLNLSGSLGDKFGDHRFEAIENQSLDKWKHTFSEWARKKYLIRFIQSIDPIILSDYGYGKEELISEVRTLPSRLTLGSLNDYRHIVQSYFIRKYYLNLFRPKIKRWTKDILLS